jgi:type II secretory pathway pseudopilin PulG
LLEFAVVLVIISTAAYFLLRGLLFAQGASEQRGFENNVAALERALSYELMSRGTRGETMDNTVLQKENPFQWLSPKPLGYAGDYPVQTNPIPGAWYWDGRRKEVVYVSKTPDRIRLSSARNDVQSGILTDKAAKMPEVRLRVVLTGNGHVHLEPIRVFQWQIN